MVYTFIFSVHVKYLQEMNEGGNIIVIYCYYFRTVYTCVCAIL